MKPKPKRHVATESFIGLQHGMISGVTELYLPDSYTDLICKVLSYKAELISLTRMKLKTEFVIFGKLETYKKLFLGEEWKVEQIIFFFEREYRHNNINCSNFKPILILLLNEHIKIDKLRLRINNKDEIATYDPSVDFVALPNSFPPLVDNIPQNENYIYYTGKSSVIYCKLLNEQIYDLEIDLEAINPYYDHAVLFPYGKTEYELIECYSSAQYKINDKIKIINPIRSKILPDQLVKKFEDMELSNYNKPLYKPATPFRDTEITFSEIKPYYNTFQSKNYEAILFQTEIERFNEKEYDITIRSTTRGIPVRIYELLQNLNGFRDTLISIDIFNFSRDKQLEIEVVTEIQGFSHKAIDNITICAYGNASTESDKSNKRARAIINQIPRLINDISTKITKPTKATLYCEINDKKNQRTLHRETHDINLLPSDYIIWTLYDPKGYREYQLFDFICSWIYNSDADGLLDQARVEAAKYHPDGYLKGYTENKEELKLQVKSIYDYLAIERKLTYVNHPFVFGITETGQRVHTPENVLKNGGGNCIDLVVLFASLMEGLGINPLIFITKNHAFIGWGNKNITSEMEFLECTGIGQMNFKESSESASATFRKEFLFTGSENPLPNELTYFSKGSTIVDLREARQKGIYSITS